MTYVSEATFHGALDAAWRARWRDARGAMSYTTQTPFGELEAAGGFSLDRPSIALLGSINAIRVALSAVARLDLTLDGVAAGGVFIEASAIVDVPVLVEQTDIFSTTKVDLSHFRVVTPGSGVIMIAPVSSFMAPFGARLAHILPRRGLEAGFGLFLLLAAGRFLVSLLAHN